MSEDCIKEFDEWMVNQKNEIYEKHIKDINNSANVLHDYADELKRFSKKIIDALDNEDIRTLDELDFPDSLKECIPKPMNNIDFKDRVIHWCITFPNTNNLNLLNEQIKESGLE
jgi:hypothetical protein